MKIVATVAALGLAAAAVPALADHHEEAAPKAEVVERDADGRATKVSVDGVVYTVCTSDQQDGCINPQEAGLDFGNVPLDRWPGEPATSGERTTGTTTE